MNLKGIPTKAIEMQINSLKELLDFYNYKNILECCPLCRTANKIIRIMEEDGTLIGSHCKYCPWVWITGVNCLIWNGERDYEVGCAAKRELDHERKLRVQQIKRWIAILIKEINGRKDEAR